MRKQIKKIIYFLLQTQFNSETLLVVKMDPNVGTNHASAAGIIDNQVTANDRQTRVNVGRLTIQLTTGNYR